MKKKILAVSLVVVLCLAICAGGTAAFFNSGTVTRNMITMGNIKIELHEKDAKGNDFKDVIGVLPGRSVDKIVTVENTGDNPCWIRVAADKSVELPEGRTGTPDLSLVELDIDTQNWTLKDGYYYYNTALASGETTKPLFTKVSFSTSMGDIFQNSAVKIDVKAQAVQTANNGDSAVTAVGWPE